MFAEYEKASKDSNPSKRITMVPPLRTDIVVSNRYSNQHKSNMD
jgi:hypothetical protein